MEHHHLYHRLIDVSEWYEGEERLVEVLGLGPTPDPDPYPPAAQDPDAGWENPPWLQQEKEESEGEEEESASEAEVAQVALEEANMNLVGGDAALSSQYKVWLEEYDEKAEDQPVFAQQIQQSMRQVIQGRMPLRLALEPSPEEDEEET